MYFFEVFLNVEFLGLILFLFYMILGLYLIRLPSKSNNLKKAVNKALYINNFIFSNYFIFVFFAFNIFVLVIPYLTGFDHNFTINDIIVIVIVNSILPIFKYMSKYGQMAFCIYNNLQLGFSNKKQVYFHITGNDLGFIKVFNHSDLFNALRDVGVEEIVLKSHLLYIYKDFDFYESKKDDDFYLLSKGAYKKRRTIKKQFEKNSFYEISIENNKMSNFIYYGIKNAIFFRKVKYILSLCRKKEFIENIPKRILKRETKLIYSINKLEMKNESSIKSEVKNHIVND